MIAQILIKGMLYMIAYTSVTDLMSQISEIRES